MDRIWFSIVFRAFRSCASDVSATLVAGKCAADLELRIGFGVNASDLVDNANVESAFKELDF
jgi:hypothetical protein